jgi:hypothetical protein
MVQQMHTCQEIHAVKLRCVPIVRNQGYLHANARLRTRYSEPSRVKTILRNQAYLHADDCFGTLVAHLVVATYDLHVDSLLHANGALQVLFLSSGGMLVTTGAWPSHILHDPTLHYITLHYIT